MKPLCVTNQMEAIEQHFNVFCLLYAVQGVPTFKSLDETLV